jgi:hypothetical protein
MSDDSLSSLVDPPPAAPAGMVEWSRTAANLLRAVGRAHPHGPPAAVSAHADHLGKLASRGATLAGALETLSKAFENLMTQAGELRSVMEQKMAALSQDESAEGRRQIEELRSDLAKYDQAVQHDLLAGRKLIESRVNEALACEKDLRAAVHALVEHLRAKPQCRELLEDIAV